MEHISAIATTRPNEEMGDVKSAAMIEANNILERFGYTCPTPRQLAEYRGFTPDQLTMLDLFWDAAFNNKWIFLDREWIKKWFCDSRTDEAAVAHFYSRYLTKPGKFIEGEQWKEIKYDDPE